MPDPAGAKAAGDAAVLTVGVAGEALALPAAAVREVLRPAPLTRVPQAPPSLLGLSNLRGAVLPVLSLARLTDRAETPPSPASRVVVMEGGAPFGLLVERVGGLSQGGQPVDLPALLARDFGARRDDNRAAPALAPEEGASEAAETVALLAFALAGQDYALPLDGVAAVARLPEGISAIPGTDGPMLGILPFRGGVLPLVSPHVLLGLPAAAATARSRLLVIRLGAIRVGLVVDALRAILRVPDSALDPVPPVLTRGRGEARVEAIARLEGGRRLVSVLSPVRLFDEATTTRLLAGAAQERAAPAASSGAAERFVILRLGTAHFGLPVLAVEEVVRRPATLVRIPRAPDSVLGAMNLRGAALPVIDPRRSLGAAKDGRAGPGGRVVVVRVDGLRAGFVVDAVPEVLAVAPADLVPAPEMALGGRMAQDGAALFDRVSRVERDGRMILLIDPRALLDRAGRDLLASIAAEPGASGMGNAP